MCIYCMLLMYLFRGGRAGSFGHSHFRFLSNHNDFHTLITVEGHTCTQQYLMLVFLLTMLTRVRQNFSVVLICISLIV